MKLAKPLIGSALLIGLMLAASAWAWMQLGDGPMATHFGPGGVPDGYSPKAVGLLVMPGVAVLNTALLTIVPFLMPSNGRLERSWGHYVVVWLSVLTLLGAIHVAMIAYALGRPVDMIRLAVIGVGLLLAVIGNLLGKVRYNYMFGVRTPWTLSSERVWDRTHRFAGWTMALAGQCMAVIGIAAPAAFAPYLHFVLVVGALIPALAATVYSYLESRRIDGSAA
jgi:uncharacterized membrane protein